MRLRQSSSSGISDAPILVDGDPIWLEQIITNLLENAPEYTPARGRIQLKLTRAGSSALLSVRDNGIGLAPEHPGSIFSLFTQVDSSLARQGGGLGIGLTVVRCVLELHGGRRRSRCWRATWANSIRICS